MTQHFDATVRSLRIYYNLSCPPGVKEAPLYNFHFNLFYFVLLVPSH